MYAGRNSVTACPLTDTRRADITRMTKDTTRLTTITVPRIRAVGEIETALRCQCCGVQIESRKKRPSQNHWQNLI
jgi:hypothetical protein